MDLQHATGSVSAFLHAEQTERRSAGRSSLQRLVVEADAVILD
jgi:hypothetical protein